MTAPRGWYSDPDGRDGLRYWDGRRWTAHFQPGRASPGATAPDVGSSSVGEPAAPAAPAPARSREKTQIEGQARAVERQHVTSSGSQGGSWQYVVTNFRIEQYDARGNRLRPIAVYLRTKLDDDMDINDGDEVRVWGKWKDGILQAKRVESLTTGASTSSPKGCAATVLVFAACVTTVSAAAMYVTESRLHRHET